MGHAIIDCLTAIFEDVAAVEYLGEDVTIAEHMLQSATLAERGRRKDSVIVGALLHDIGHVAGASGMFSMTDTEDRHHELAGARLVERFFPAVVTDCIRHHVAAKRYLSATRRGYLDRLSDASRHSLFLQSGPMGAHEVKQFARHPHLDEIIAVRLLDDAGKRSGMKTPGFPHFVPIIESLLEQHRRSQSKETHDAA